MSSGDTKVLLAGVFMQAAGNFSAITLRDGSAKAKVQLLPFDDDEYGVFALSTRSCCLTSLRASVSG